MPLTINMTFVGFPDQATKDAVTRAAATWENALTSQVDVAITAYWNQPLGTLVGMCIPNAMENFDNAPVADTWYASALADKLAGEDLQQNTADLALYFNSGAKDFYVGTGQPQANQFDLESNALHEMCHGLGFFGLFWVETQRQPKIGSYGSNLIVGAIPGNLNLPFQLPNLNGHQSAFGRWVQDQNNDLLTAMPNNTNQLANKIQSDHLSFRTPNQSYRVYSPPMFEPFQSGDHFLPPSMMQPTLAKGTTKRAIGADVMAAMTRVGW